MVPPTHSGRGSPAIADARSIREEQTPREPSEIAHRSPKALVGVMVNLRERHDNTGPQTLDREPDRDHPLKTLDR